MPRVVTIDIETRPAPNDPLNVGDQDQNYLKTALNGDFGQILCIGYVDESLGRAPECGVLGWDENEARLTGDEAAVLEAFWNRLRDFRTGPDRIVGHNIFDFDLKFILKRSIILGVKPTVDFSFARYRNHPVFDTMHEWERWSYGGRISLHVLAEVLGLPSSKKDGIDGSKIWELYCAGQHRLIKDYCLRDVKLTRAIYRRMVFAALPAPAGGAPTPILTASAGC